MNPHHTFGKNLYLPIILRALLLSAIAVPASADTPLATTNQVRVPVPVYFIYPPLTPLSTTDEEFASGRVVEGQYTMTTHASKPWRIAFLFPHLKDPYWIGCDYGVISEAKRLGVAADIFPADGYDDLVGQLLKMDDVIAAKYDAIVISPISLNANNASIAKARAQGIPVFELANDSTSDDLTTKVTTSLKGMGNDATAWVIRDAQQRGMKVINVALLPGPRDAGWVRGEVAGTRETARTAAIKVNIVDIKYGDSDRIGQTQLTDQLLAEHGQKLDYIIGCSGCAPAAILPMKQAGLGKKIRLVAYDLTREIAGLIRKGEIVAAVDTRGVSQARVAINAAVDFLEGRTKHQPSVILIKLGLVDKGSYASYPFNASTAPDGFTPILSYAPGKAK